MLAFTDSQLRTVWDTANRVPVEKRRLSLNGLLRDCSSSAASAMPISTTHCVQH
jgi:hypothetical protein